MRSVCYRVASALAIIWATTAGAVAEGDATKGREIAEQSCARCHDIEPGGPPKLYPPSFASIAGYRTASQIYNRIVLPPLHSNMPTISDLMSPDTIDDVVAYIVSLEEE